MATLYHPGGWLLTPSSDNPAPRITNGASTEPPSVATGRPGSRTSGFLVSARTEHLSAQDRPPPLFSGALVDGILSFPENRDDPSRLETRSFCQTGFWRPVWVAPRIARGARSLWGMPGGLGIASAIEPAGGVSPLRGGVGNWRGRSYRQDVTFSYRKPIGS